MEAEEAYIPCSSSLLLSACIARIWFMVWEIPERRELARGCCGGSARLRILELAGTEIKHPAGTMIVVLY